MHEKLQKGWPFFIISLFILSNIYAQQQHFKRGPHPDDLPSIADTLANTKIVWDTTERKISHDTYFAEYGRIKRLTADTLLLVYHFGSKGNEWDNIGIRQSNDNGKTWSAVRMVAADNQPKRYSGFSTPELLQLQNGWLMMAYTGRGIPDDSLHNDLQVRISKDRGRNWGAPVKVALGRSWEPGMVQLANGEIQLFFANELYNKNANDRPEQQVLLTRSNNNGQSWSKPELIAFTPKARDGMPVPLLLKDGKGLVVFMESVENRLSPELVWTSMKANWNYQNSNTVQNGRRWYTAVEPMWGGGPYAIQLPSGEVILAMQTEGGRKIERYKQWKKKTVTVMVGNSVAKNFGNLSWPYPNLPITEGRYFCSLFLKDAQTVVLVSTRNFPDGHSEIYWKEGRVVAAKP